MVKAFVQKVETQLYIILIVLLTLWLQEILDFVLFHGELDKFGILPRTVTGLKGIIFSPFLHYGFIHLLSNSIPLAVLSWFVMIRSIKEYFVVTILVIIISGFSVWLLGRGNTFHIGASGVIFGYFGYIMGKGIFERSVLAILIAVITGFLYGGMIWGILPIHHYMSWEAHLFGFLSGFILSTRSDKR